MHRQSSAGTRGRMGKQWQVGGLIYEDCDHCGLSFNVAGQLKYDHVGGACVESFGRKEDKPQHGKGKEAEARTALGFKIVVRGSRSHSSSGHIVEASQDVGRERTVESGWA